MKFKALLSSLLLVGTLIMFYSCGSDDDSNGSFTFDGNNYTLSAGLIEDYGSNGNGSWDYDVTLVSDGISFANDELTGTGDFVYLDLNTSSNGGLESGTYNWSSTRGPLTIVSATVGLDFNVETLSGTGVNLTGGSVTVDVSGQDVTITLNLEATGMLLTGTYSGPLEEL
ncbi:MAG: hypothetical protein HKN09_11730 [Saprospiraceae bacterium]|nr:hypothetical protein [Saprospiraceae bacterium]